MRDLRTDWTCPECYRHYSFPNSVKEFDCPFCQFTEPMKVEVESPQPPIVQEIPAHTDVATADAISE
jgi:hypothetical protein